MASSLLTTDKRWGASTRKSGMTVLGKIPKPINLPSQRLENHGLDPNVELVPKGTITWGSKQAATTPNAWSSSSLLSPKNDGVSGSPSHINGRPSSGGGSRPSTAGSESLDSPNAWGPNSRPSTASGTLPSHHLPMATTRPQSAETRPGSSQLSRFADNHSENIKVSIRTIEKSGSSSHGHGFTLSTGDFPSLGSEKSSETNSQRGHSSKGRPSSSSGKETAENEQGKSPTAGSGEVILSATNRPVDVMKTEQHAYDRGAPFPATSLPNEIQQQHPYPPNFCGPPPQFDSWHAPPGHPPEGIWHRGPPPGGPYRPVALPGSFPVEPFPYYGQFPHNSEAAARQGSAQGGYHHKNGDAYQSMPPNSYIMNQPVIPVRPVYQGPMPYDGYYGSPRANFNNSNARDSPFVGGPHQPGILNQVPNQNDKFQPGYSQNRPMEQLESDRVHVARRGQPRILHDNPDRLGGPCEVERKAQPTPPLLPNPDVNRADVNMRADVKGTFSERNRVVIKSVPDRRGPTGINQSFSENAHSYPMEADNGTLRKKFKEDNLPTRDLQPVIKKNVALMEKIESLNNKVRNVDAQNIAEPFSSKEHKDKQQKGTNVKADQKLPNMPIDGVVVGPLHAQLTDASKVGNLGDTHRRDDSSRNSHHGPAKDKLSNNFARSAQGENSTSECSPIVYLSNSQHDQPVENASQLMPVTVTDDMAASLDYESQRVKMRELAAQRAKQLQIEEEERTKQQKAKALAKLEELNRRSSVHQKNTNDASPEVDSVCNKQKAGHDVSAKPATSIADSSEPPTDPKHSALPVQSKSATLPDAAAGSKVPADHIILSSSSNTQGNTMGHVAQKNISQLHDISVSKPKQGYRKRQVVSEVKIPGEKSGFTVSTENARELVESSLDAPASIVTLHDEPAAQNKKSARHPRNRKKLDDAPVTSKHKPMLLNEQNTVKVSNEPKTQTAGVIISSSIVPTEGTLVTVGSITVGGISFGSLSQECSKPLEEAHNTPNGHPRMQHAKRSGKNQHAVRPIEKPQGNEGVVWAPVKSSGQIDQSDEAALNTAVVAPTHSAGKNTNDGEAAIRTKRAEMERYVPKPLSKELQELNLGQNLQSEKSHVDNRSHDKEAVEKSTAAKAEATADHKKSEDKKTSRGHGKSHSSWRRRNTNESVLLVPNPANRVDYSQESDKVKKPSDQHQTLEPDKQADDAAENSLAPTVVSPAGPAKEHGATNRQKRQHARTQRNEGSNYSNENKDREGRKNEHQMPTMAMDSNSSEYRNMSRADVKNSGAATHSRAHWKPKSNPLPQSNLQGNNAMGEQVDNSTRQDHNLPRSIGVTGENNVNSEPSKGETSSVDDNQNSGIHEYVEQQQLIPAPRHQGHHNGRYHRGSGTHRGRGYDAGKPSHGTNTERRRGGTHLEYQPVGSYHKAADFHQNPSCDERTEGAPAPGPVYRERSHNRGPRPAGHFVKRNPVTAPAADPYQDE